ncbi:MAG: FAD-dependent oxidoreductase [Elusimicrobiota bacterium]
MLINHKNGKSEQKTVAVLGAGPAGLAAATKLAAGGYKVCIFDERPDIGGLCASIKYGDFIFDFGGHRFYPDNEKVLDEIKKIAPSDLVVRKRNSSIFIRRKFVAYPLRLGNLLFNMSPVILFAAMLEYMGRSVKNMVLPLKEKTLKDWLLNRFGRVLYDIYFKPYTEKFWGLSIDDISVEWASSRITLVGFWDVMLRLFSRKKSVPATYIKEYFYPDLGIGAIFEKMGREIENNGGEINLCNKIRNVYVNNGTAQKILIEKDGEETLLKCDYVISTVPLPELVSMLEPQLEAEYQNMAGTVKYRAMLFVFLIINRESISGNNWVYFPEDDYVFSRITEPKNWSARMAPKDKTSLCVEIPLNTDDDLWNMDDSLVMEEVAAGLSKAGFLERNEIVDYFTQKWRYSYPVYTGDYRKTVDSLMLRLSDIGNLALAGRQGRFVYATATDAMKMGFDAAEEAERYFDADNGRRV